MNTQNILKFYGFILDVKLDSSEYYDFELTTDNDYDHSVLDFTSGGTKTYDKLVFDSSCLTNINLPITIEINSGYTEDNCNFLINDRVEKGWTLDLIFDKTNINWSDGKTFYYLGISGETDPSNYLDNNLSFSFSNDGKIIWESYHVSGTCTNTGYTITNYISSGITSTLNVGDVFNMTITFERYKELNLCDLSNRGGLNDLITGYTVTNIPDVITGATENIEMVETLNTKWYKSREDRLGILKIYINGKKIYQINDWEEIIPSQRNSTNKLIQKYGGGTINSGNIHSGDTLFNITRIKYFEESLNSVNIYHHYMTTTKNLIDDITVQCENTITPYSTLGLITENKDILLTENNDIIIY